jgi:hypothetical protein
LARVVVVAPQMLGTISSGDNPSMEHLACFVPGMLALGAYNADGSPLANNKWTHLIHAKALTYVRVWLCSQAPL